MRPAELLLRSIVAVCGPLGNDATVTLTLEREARGNRARLFGRHGGPLCEVLCAREGQTVVAAPARELADWLSRKGLAWTRKDGGRIFACDDEGEIEIVMEVRE